MQRRTALYIRSAGTSGEPALYLHQMVEAGDDIVVGVFADREDGRRRCLTGWKSLLAGLDGVDQIALASAGDIPARTLGDLLRFLAILKDHGVGLLLLAENINTGHGSALTVLEIIEAFRRAKLSRNIREGQAKARAAGKIIGRPEVPASVRRRIEASVAAGNGIRPTARKFGVAPATVLNIFRSMAQIDAEAA